MAAKNDRPQLTARTHVGGSVGAGAVVISGTVHGSVSVAVAVASSELHIDRRCVAETLQAMSALDGDQRLSVLKFMEREFSTQMVKELSADAQQRVRRYVAAVLRGAGKA
jgi:hypothetical protein